MARTAIVTSTAADLTEELAAAHSITVVPSIVTFGDDAFAAGVELTTDAFWRRMLAPDAPFPQTAPPTPGAFAAAYAGLFETGADAIVSVQMGGEMSATVNSATVAAEMFRDREIHVVDTGSASMATGLLALLGAEMAELHVSAGEIARVLAARAPETRIYAVLDTLEYLRRGGRISGAVARIGTYLAVKPIITVADGRIQIVDRPRTRQTARERLVTLLTAHPAEWLAVMYSPPADAGPFRDEVVARLPGGIDPSRVIVYPIGSTNGPHMGPGCLGGVVLPADPS